MGLCAQASRMSASRARYCCRAAALLVIASCLPSPAPTALPSGVEAVSLMGDTLRVLPLASETRERYQRQLADARDAWRRHPTNLDSIIWYGRRLAYLGRYREAIEVYTRGLDQHPEDPWLLRHRGHRWISVREFARAIADLRRAERATRGKPDQIEPDGQPNERNQPIGTLHSNIRYHLGLAHYLRGEWDDALRVYRDELTGDVNDDRRVSVTHWAYLASCRQGRTAEAQRWLVPIRTEMQVIENAAYHRLTLLYKGVLPADSVLGATVGSGITDVSTAYGVGTWHLCRGRRDEAMRIYRAIVATGQWAAFGFIAAEAELRRLR